MEERGVSRQASDKFSALERLDLPEIMILVSLAKTILCIVVSDNAWNTRRLPLPLKESRISGLDRDEGDGSEVLAVLAKQTAH